ncbi:MULTISPECIES: TadE/TadG family type IV pilus assembly protein [Pseudomonas]|uniref:TadE/TadG family type IV pilus assembly protein n=1 Tax=Pseudomonas TaxID=286 RepID=UPI000DA66977|nr:MULTISPECIES: TadE family protein [Pseudomonas]
MKRKQSQRGSALLETVLVFPVLIGVTLLAADLYNLHQARSYMEQSAHTIASVLGVQSTLDNNGLQALVERATSMNRTPVELIISKVESDRSMNWRPLYRGEAQGVCERHSAGSRFTGEFPDALRADDEQTLTSVPTVVVQVCASVDALALSYALLGSDKIEVQAISRLQHGTPTLDDVLTRELDPQEDE